MRTLLPYIEIARIDHWFKNLFMVLGVLLALFHDPELATDWGALVNIVVAVAATCLVASSNYVINELLDAPTDREHPTKRHRPVPSGRVVPGWAIFEWLLLGAVGLGIAFTLNAPFGLSALALWIMGVVYNVRPLRSKELPYLDVISESVNNPLRLLLGWHALVPDLFPPSSLLISYWMIGAYFMAMKRLAEYRFIGDPEVAASYRKSFVHYDDARLLVSIMFYATACAFFGGVFVVRYKIELILFLPFAAGFCAYYMKLGLMPDSPVQNPEKLYKEYGFVVYGLFCVALFVLLMFGRIPFLHEAFEFMPSDAPIWWTLP
ncbi:MAG: UbiA prenyltransferase family protein [Planctomycetes bacterium]|nr:UbiA prenyltransferase family protein [Planctomycetota bacterium]